MFVVHLIYNLAVLVTVSVISGFIDARWGRNTKTGKILQGVIFGAIAILAMLNPYKLADGIIFDGRSIVLSLSALFFGPVTGIIAGLMAATTRLIIGGNGAMMGVSVISASVIIGILLYLRKQKSYNAISALELYLFGIVVHIAMLILMFLLPSKFVWVTFQTIAISVLIFYPIATVIIGKILVNDEKTARLVAELRETSESLAITLKSIGDAVISTDVAGYVTGMNPIAETLTGWSLAEAKGKPLTEIFNIINEETRQQIDSPVYKVLKEGVIVALANHTLLISKSGSEIPIADSGAPIKNDSGKTVGVVLVFRDQTDERESRKEIEKSELRLRRAELASKSGNWELHLSTQKMIASFGAAKIYGVNSTELNYETVKNIPLKEFRPVLDLAFKKLIEKNEPYDVEFKLQSVDSGKIKDIHSVAFYDKETDVIFGVIQDISERKNAEEELFESEAKYRSLFNANKDGISIFYLNPDETISPIIIANKSAAEMLGFSLDELIGKHPYEFEKEQSVENFQARGEILKTSGFINFETELLNKNGESIPVEISALVMKYNNKPAIMNIVRDITNRKLAEKELLNKMDELQRFHSLTVDRELAMIELKKEVNSMLLNLKQKEKYRIIE